MLPVLLSKLDSKGKKLAPVRVWTLIVLRCDKMGWENSTLVSCIKSPHVHCMARPSISTADSYRPSGGGRAVRHLIVAKGRWAGRLSLSAFPSSGVAKTFLVSKGGRSHTPSHRLHTDPLPPTWDCELVAGSHTHRRGASATADCDRNGWKLLLPPSCLALYIVVSLPQSFTLSGGFICARLDWRPTWVPPPLSPGFFAVFPLPLFNSFFLPASVPSCVSTSHHSTLCEGKFQIQCRSQLELWCCISIWITFLWQTVSTQFVSQLLCFFWLLDVIFKLPTTPVLRHT